MHPRIFKRIVDTLLMLVAVYMIFNGLVDVLATSGRVVSNEFGMLVTIANELALMTLLAGLFSIRVMLIERVAASDL